MTDKKNYVALLRGINVGGHSIIKMEELKKQFESFGVNEVKTYIQSGNVLFTSGKINAVTLARKIEQHLGKKIKYEGTVFILTPKELKSALELCPFGPERNEEKQLCHIMFLSKKPGKQQIQKLMQMEGEEYSFAVNGKVLYYAYPLEYAGPRRRNINFEKVLGVAGTARSWKVVKKLIELSEG